MLTLREEDFSSMIYSLVFLMLADVFKLSLC
jgi:hypothetical protein